MERLRLQLEREQSSVGALKQQLQRREEAVAAALRRAGAAEADAGLARTEVGVGVDAVDVLSALIGVDAVDVLSAPIGVDAVDVSFPHAGGAVGVAEGDLGIGLDFSFPRWPPCCLFVARPWPNFVPASG